MRFAPQRQSSEDLPDRVPRRARVGVGDTVPAEANELGRMAAPATT
ncbi:MAG: hypothetical protein Q8S20_02515 [Sulfuritalea sp.]|nr:hypothetical protein [Sulfuritalea sp.]